MKKILFTSIAATALLATPLAHAWTYSDGDVLLIFRENGFNDVEFDIGRISQFTNLASGTTITVPNWNVDLVTGVFGSDLTSVSVIAVATTSRTAPDRASWITGADPSDTVYDLTPSTWQSKLWSTINGIGTKPVLNELSATTTNGYSIDPQGVTGTASYDYVVTGGFANLAAVAQFGANVDFTVEGVAPSSFAFWKILATTANPKPAAQYVGTFIIDATGNLTFTAGPLVSTVTPSTITGITRAGNLNTIAFTTTASGNYSLAYTNQLGAPVSTWPIVSGPISGDGSNKSLNHTTTDSGGFYGVVRTP